MHEVTNIHPLPADGPIDRRCNVRKFKFQVEPNRVPGSTSGRYGRTLSFRSVLRGANLNRRSSLWQWDGTCAFGEIKPHSGSLTDFAILRLMRDLELRGAEIVKLCLEDIDWRAGTLVVRDERLGANIKLQLDIVSFIDIDFGGRPKFSRTSAPAARAALIAASRY